VRRVSVASVVAVVAAVGLGITFFNQSGGLNSAIKLPTARVATASATTSGAKYQVVNRDRDVATYSENS
jgi:hypothetical protein